MIDKIESGDMLECFATGTAVTVGAINLINKGGKDYSIPVDESVGAGPLAKKLYTEILDI